MYLCLEGKEADDGTRTKLINCQVSYPGLLFSMMKSAVLAKATFTLVQRAPESPSYNPLFDDRTAEN